MAPPGHSVHTPKTGRWNRAKTVDFNTPTSPQNAQKYKENMTPVKRSQPWSWRSKSVEFHLHATCPCDEKHVDDSIPSEWSIIQVKNETPTSSSAQSIRVNRRSATWDMFEELNAAPERLQQGCAVYDKEPDEYAAGVGHSQASDQSHIQQFGMCGKASLKSHISLSSCGANTEMLSDDLLAKSLSSSANSLDSFMASSPTTFGQMLLEDKLKEVVHQRSYYEALDNKFNQREQELQEQMMKVRQNRQELFEKRKCTDADMAKIAFEQGGGPINWGISVHQLVKFCEEIKPRLRHYCLDHRLDPKTFCHVCLRDQCPHDHGCANHRASHPNEDMTSLPNVEPNMHTVVALFIKPLTRDTHGLRGLALKLNLEQPKQVEKFVSHSWTGRFEDFVGTLSRKMLPETVVFICSFALPQNLDLNAMLGTDLESTPFALAHELACEVCLVIDESVDVIARAWVIYELYLSLARKKPLQIALTKTGADFHQKIMHQVPSIDVRHSKASKESDLRAIKTTLAGKEDELNKAIRRKLKEGVHQQHADSEFLRDTTNLNWQR